MPKPTLKKKTSSRAMTMPVLRSRLLRVARHPRSLTLLAMATRARARSAASSLRAMARRERRLRCLGFQVSYIVY